MGVKSSIALRQRLEEAVPNAELQGISAQDLAHNTQEKWGAKRLTLGELKERLKVLDSPVGDAPITSAFGVDRSFGSSPHKGTDYGVSIGTRVNATADGFAERVYYSDTLGNTVILNHGPSPHGGGNVYTLYAHGNSTSIVQGKSVSAGQNIMVSGNTGRTTTGAHLHYEIILTNHSPFSQQFFDNISKRYAPNSLSSLLGY